VSSVIKYLSINIAVFALCPVRKDRYFVVVVVVVVVVEGK